MTATEIEATTDCGTVRRVGFEPNPCSSRIYATDAGLFDGRWDDQRGQFRTSAAIDEARALAAQGLPSMEVDAALLKDADDRILTRSIARSVYDLRGSDRHELADGIEFRSRFGDEIGMWAIFERSLDESRYCSKLITPEWNAPVRPETPELTDAFTRLGCTGTRTGSAANDCICPHTTAV